MKKKLGLMGLAFITLVLMVSGCTGGSTTGAKDPVTGKWKRKWLSGYRTRREAEKTRAEAVAQAGNGWLTIPSRETVATSSLGNSP